MSNKRSIGVLLFEGFELLDVFGPLEMYGMAADHFDIRLVYEDGSVIASRQGPKSIVDVPLTMHKSLICCWFRAV